MSLLNMKYGYARVSTKDQNLDLQMDALKKSGCEKYFMDVASGAKADRPELQKMLNEVRKDDVVVIWKLDRLGRSLKHLVELVETLSTKSVGLKSLNDPVDTTTPQGKLTFNIFASLAEFERDIISERTKAGLNAARARGRKGGRPKGLSKEAQSKACAAETLYNERKLSVQQICEQLNISKATIYSYLRYRGVQIGEEKSFKRTKEKDDIAREKTPKEQKTIEVVLWLRVENNNKFVRGKTKSTQDIEDYVLSGFDMKKSKNKNWEYILTIPYENDEDLDETIYRILRDADSHADMRNGFIEADVRTLDGNRSW